MNPPHLNRLMALQAAVQSPDGMGGFTTLWQTLGSHWVHLKAGAGRETAAGEQLLGQVAYRITLRAAPPGDAARPKPGQRLVEGERCFLIRAVADLGPEARYLICHCHEEERQ